MYSKRVSGGVLSSRRKVLAFVVVVVTGLGVLLQSWSAVNAGVVESRLLPVRPVTVCVDGQGVVSRVLVDGSCGGVVVTWSSKSPAPQLCWDNSSLSPTAQTRVVYVGTASGCGSQREVISGGVAVLCADRSTGVLRWPVTKVCKSENITTRVSVGGSIFGRSTGTTVQSTTTTSTTTTSTTVALARAPQVSRISADNARMRFTLSGMSPDTGNYAVQWVERGQSFNTYNMRQVTERDVALPIGDFACGGRTYTFRVFVMRSDWTLSQGHSNQNVTPHSELFDVTTTHACPVATTVATVGTPTTYTVTYDGNTFTSGTAPTDATEYTSGATVTVSANTGFLAKSGGHAFRGWCTTAPAAGGECRGTAYAAASTFAISSSVTLYAQWCVSGASSSYCVGDTGPGGGTVFYVTSGTFTTTGADSECTTTCKFLEFAPVPVGGEVAERRTWATDTDPGIGRGNQATAVPGATGTGIGSGSANTDAIYAQTGNVAATSAAVYAWGYGNGGKTDWYLPSSAEFNEIGKYARNTGQAAGPDTACSGGSGPMRGGFITGSTYWTSTEQDDPSLPTRVGEFAVAPVICGALNVRWKYETNFVRPVRAFR